MSARAHLKVVSSNPTPRPRPPIIEDDIFFHKSQLHYGTRLIYYGRLDPMSIWEIVDIKSYFLGKVVGQYSLKKVPEIRHLNDILYFRKINTNETKKMSFGYLSYSAIWRLAPDQ
jgi:hypothetical protein